MKIFKTLFVIYLFTNFAQAATVKINNENVNSDDYAPKDYKQFKVTIQKVGSSQDRYSFPVPAMGKLEEHTITDGSYLVILHTYSNSSCVQPKHMNLSSGDVSLSAESSLVINIKDVPVGGEHNPLCTVEKH